MRPPVSQMLFMLYLAPIFRLGKPKARFGYTDDIIILVVVFILAVVVTLVVKRIFDPSIYVLCNQSVLLRYDNDRLAWFLFLGKRRAFFNLSLAV